MAADPGNVTLVPAAWSLPQSHGLQVVPIRPVPLFPWYAVWRSGTPHSLVPLLLGAARADDHGPDPTREQHWLPAGVRNQRLKGR